MRLHSIVRGTHVLPATIRRARSAQAGVHRNVASRSAQPARAMLEQLVTEKDERLHTSNSNSENGPKVASEPGAPATPGEDDRKRFQLHWSVDMWRTFYPQRWLEGVSNESEPAQERLRAFTDTLTAAVSSAGVLGSSEAARYWGYHLTRTGFFMFTGLVSVVAARQALGSATQSVAVSRFEELISRGWAGPFTEAMLMYWQDYQLIKEGRYVLPYDMATLQHRQFNPLYVLRKGAAFMREAVDTLRRRDAGVPDNVWLRAPQLPEYYDQSTFHYQTDGWLSSRSADVYETSTETLFVGRQDAMQRSTLVPIADFLRGRDASQLQALEVAAGTGRFATFLKDNHPSLRLTVSDLSPFYLQQARDNMRYWKRLRAPDAQLGGVDGTGVSFIQTAAENLMGVEDESMDIVYCIYLFHELPLEVRKRAIREMARVVKPGGLVVLTDSAQVGDREAYDKTLGNFSDFNEPYYVNYINTPLGPLFQEAGLECGMKLVGSSTKTLSFRKPLPDEVVTAAGDAASAAVAAAAEVVQEGKEDP